MVELIKRRFKGLYQINDISSLEVEDTYEPVEQGMDSVTRKRRLAMLVVILSKDPLDKTHCGYQDPLPDKDIQDFQPGPRKGPPT